MPLAVLLLATLAVVPAKAAPYAALVIDADTGKILHQVNADQPRYPASLTKMMTLYLMFEALEQGELRLNDRMKVSANAASQPPSSLRLKRGERIRVRDALLALVTKSANDVAVVVAEHLAGSERRFARRMTAKARHLGMTRTVFRNPSGLPNDAQTTTALDMAILARALINHFPRYYSYFSHRRFTYRNAVYRNHNRLLETFDGVDGIKTGYIRASGFNLVASAERNGKRLIAIVFGAPSSKARNKLVSSLLDTAFGNRNFARVSVPWLNSNTNDGPQLASIGEVGGAPTRGWTLQVGAFTDRGGANHAVQRAKKVVGNIVRRGTTRVERDSYARGMAYFARIVNLTKSEAKRACRRLKKKRMDCLTYATAGVGSDDIVPVSARVLPSAVPRARPETRISGSRGDWAVQVGAFPNRALARKEAERARRTARSMLRHGAIRVAPIKRSRGGTLYRARIVGIDQNSARAACDQLATRRFECLAMRH